VGHLYRGIEAGLTYLCDRDGEAAVFIGPPSAQAVTGIFEWPELMAVTDLASAHQAIEMIVEQGEGARGDWTKSHFGTFVGILEDLLAVQEADPAFNPARPVEPAFVRLPPDVQSGTVIEDALTAAVAGQTCDSLAKEPGVAALTQLAQRLCAIADEVSNQLATRVEQL